MVMTDEEIRNSWMNAASPATHARILAQLNAVEESVILEKLRSLGIIANQRKGQKRVKGQKVKNLQTATLNQYQDNAAKRMYFAGYSVREIATILDISEYRVMKWREKNGFRSKFAYTGKEP